MDRPLRVVVAPDKLRGSATSLEAAQALARGLVRGRPGTEVVVLPVADGGDGVVDAVVAAGWERREADVTGPTGEPVRASYAVQGRRAAVETAEACGLRRLPGGTPAPLTATTYGAGELLLAALDAGATEVVLGLGGSATTDGGAGLWQALGARLLAADGSDLPPGGAALRDLDRVDRSGLDPRLAGVRVVLACDVEDRLADAARVYGPQKGATPDDVEVLAAGLRRWAEVLGFADRPSAGAAGGLAAGTMALLDADVRSGTDLLLDLVGLPAALVGADLCVTGEGRFDETSLRGKAPVGVRRAAEAAGVPVALVAGRVDAPTDGFAHVLSLVELAGDEGAATRDALHWLEVAGERLSRAATPSTPPGR